MSTTNVLSWKSYQGREHCYWSAYKQSGDIGLISKFKTKADGSLGDGYNPEVYGPFELEGYVYSAVQKTSRDGTKKYFDIERVAKAAPASQLAAPKTSNGDYDKRQDQIQKNYEERLKFDKERLAFDRENKAAMEGLTRALTELNSHTLGLLARTEALYEQMQILVSLLAKSRLFDSAAELLKKQAPELPGGKA